MAIRAPLGWIISSREASEYMVGHFWEDAMSSSALCIELQWVDRASGILVEVEAVPSIAMPVHGRLQPFTFIKNRRGRPQKARAILKSIVTGNTLRQ